MKFKDISKLSKDEMGKKLSDLKTELMKLNAQVAIGTTPKSTKQIRDIKRAIAKFETLKMQNVYKDADALKAHSAKMLKNNKVKKHIHL